MAHSQSKTFWSFLILVDVLLLVAFGWALADRLYAVLEEPVASIQPTHLPKARTLHKVDETKAGPAGPPAPAPAAAPASAGPATADHGKAGPEPKKPEPAHIKKEAPAHAKKEAPAAKKPEPEPAAPSSSKARKVVFTYRNWSAKKVSIEGTFTKWKSQAMHKGKNGEWTFTTYLLPGANYPYRFLVDGKMIADPENPRQKWGKSLMPVK